MHQKDARDFEMDRLQAEIARLRKGVQDYLDGNYEPKVRKMDKCLHGQYGYEICEACIDGHFTRLLAHEQRGTHETTGA